MTKKSVVLHVGNFKTGTSAIQAYCHRHRAELLALGVAYPDCARPASNPSNHGRLPLALLQKYGCEVPDWYRDQCSYEQVARETYSALANSSAASLLISSEEFYRIPLAGKKRAAGMAADLSELFADFNVRVVMYVRPPFDFARSWYGEVNKARAPRRRFIDFIYYLQEGMLVPDRNARFWRHLFGEQAVHFQAYRGHDDNHIERFLGLLGCDTIPVSALSASVVNKRADEGLLERKRLMKIRSLPSREQRKALLRSDALASVDNFARLKAKIERIEENFKAFCADEGLDMDVDEFSMAALLVYDEKVNRRDVVQAAAVPALVHRLRFTPIGDWAKRLRDSLHSRGNRA